MLEIILMYFIGSIPFGLILSKTFGDGNLQSTGSKSIGATNVFRTQGKLLGIATFILDFLKGFLPCYFFTQNFYSLNNTILIVMCIMPIIGHIFSVWLKGSGGKGIATYLGVLLFLQPKIFLLSIIVWVLVFAIFKISSISGISSMIFSLCAMCINENFMYTTNFMITLICVTLIIIKHKDNIKRLIDGTELGIRDKATKKSNLN